MNNPLVIKRFPHLTQFCLCVIWGIPWQRGLSAAGWLWAMSLFGRIASINDVLSRVTQLNNRLDKLEEEYRLSRTNSRGSFSRRCFELNKLIEDQKNRITLVKSRESDEDQKSETLEKLADMQTRLTQMTPISQKDQETRKPAPMTRRPSMYDEETSEEEEDNTQGKLQAVVEEESEEESVQPVEAQVIVTKEATKKISPESSIEEERQEKQSPRISAPKKTPLPVKVTKAKELVEKEEIESQDDLSYLDGNEFIVISNLKAAQKGDLAIHRGECLRVIQTRSDGWWTAENDRGEIGMVPMNFLEHYRPEIEEEPEDIRPSIPRVLAVATSTQVRCLGDALRADPHLTIACHLAPRLSYSNLAFHDILWNYRDDMLRKRRVRVSRMIRLVRLENMPQIEANVYLIRIALYDKGRKTGKQIVSNIYSIRASVKGTTWTFSNKLGAPGAEMDEIYIRSNYMSKDVVLWIEASAIILGDDGQFKENSLRVITFQLTNNEGHCSLQNRTYSEVMSDENFFSGNEGKPTISKIILKVYDVSQDLVSYADSMPDVLIYNPSYLKITYYYRRRAGTVLIRDKGNLLNAEMVSDPLLATFPVVADQGDLMDLLRDQWIIKSRQLKTKKEAEQTETFFMLYMKTAFCLHGTAIWPDYCAWNRKVLEDRQKVIGNCLRLLKEYGTPTRFLLTQPCRPLNIHDLSLDLLGTHALD